MRGSVDRRSCSGVGFSRIPARAAVVTRAAGAGRNRHGLAVDVDEADAAEIVDGRIVEEPPVIPAAALVAEAIVAVAVMDAAIKADVGRPVAAMEQVDAADERPVAGSPQKARLRRLDPYARHPVVVVVVPGPVAGRPDVAGRRHRRLIVVRHRRGGLVGLDDRTRGGALGRRTDAFLAEARRDESRRAGAEQQRGQRGSQKSHAGILSNLAATRRARATAQRRSHIVPQIFGMRPFNDPPAPSLWTPRLL